jgi:hypothetical protein
MPKTDGFQNRLQTNVFVDNPVYIAFYEKDPGSDPESTQPTPVEWDKGSFIEFSDWDTDGESSYNKTELTLVNNGNKDVNVRYFVLWQDPKGDKATYWGAVVNDSGKRVSPGKSLVVKAYDLEIKET